jgi:hypothetical protein
MAVLGATTREYCVADTDPKSIADLRRTAARLIGRDHVTVVECDGVAAILEALPRLEPAAASTTFALIDPYRPLEPTTAGLSPAELWARLASRGVKTMPWYGFETVADHAVITNGIRAALDRHRAQGHGMSIWAGEITVAGFGSQPPAWNPGAPGCGILCTNLSQQAMVACQELGSALQSLYTNALLPNGDDGSLDFRTLRRW